MNQADIQHIRPEYGLQSIIGKLRDPLAVFKRICIAENYDHVRSHMAELQLSLPGIWCQYDVTLTWSAEQEHLQLCLAFQGRNVMNRTDDICRLLSLLNERLSSGHFEYWDTLKSLVYRHTVSLRGGGKLSTEQAMDMIASALDAAERGFPAAQYVLWAGKTPEDALDAALVDLSICS